MTDAEIERIARRYCEMRGLDPDEPVYPPLTRKRWEIYKGDIREALALQEAIAEVRGEKGVGG